MFTYYGVVLLLMNHSCWGYDHLIILCNKLQDYLEETEPCSLLREKILRQHTKTIVKESCNVIDFRNQTQDLLKFNFLADFTVLSFIFCFCLHAIAANPLASLTVYVAIQIMLVQLFVYCWMGERLIKRIEELSVAVYDIKWYTMSVKNQKEVQIILALTQGMKGFNGIFNAVNMETFQKVRSNSTFLPQVQVLKC